MLKNWLFAYLGLLGLSSSAIPALAQSVPSNIIPDNTLGNQRSIVERTNTLESIRGGAQSGQNLFHSFSEFNVGDGQRVYFANPTGVQNILTRVTGTSASNIFGTLGVDGNANLFLINPNGILFGTNAQLDVRGSFVGTTANGIGFGTQGVFNATNPDAPPLLTVNPSAFLFNQINPGKITTRSIVPIELNTNQYFIAGLRVPNGQNLVLVGGDIEIDGGGKGGGLLAQEGRIELGGLAAPGPVGLSQDNNLMKLSFPVGVTRSNVTLTDIASVFVAGNNAGSVGVNAQNLNLLKGSDITGGILTGSAGSKAGDIEINVVQNLIVGDNKSSSIENNVFPKAVGDAGNLTINTNSLRITNGSSISSLVRGKGNAGNLSVNAADVTISGERPAANGIAPSAGGLFSQIEGGGIGNAGNLTLTTGRLNVSDGGKVQTATFGSGKAGNLFIKADEINVFNTPGVNSFYLTNINAGVSFDVTRNVDSSGQPILANGESGSLTIETRRLVIRNEGSSNGVSISADTRGIGNAGKPVIRASESIEIVGQGSSIAAKVDPDAIGDGGQIEIDTPRLIIRDRGRLTANSSGAGKAGNLTVNAKTIELRDGGTISTQTLSGQGGTILLKPTDYLLMSGNSQISTTAGTAQQGGDGGNVTIETKFVIATPRENNDITANAFTGKGGRIQINAQSILGLQSRSQTTLDTNDITASSQFGSSGTVTLNTPDLDPSRGLTVLPTTTTDPTNQINPNCSAKAIGNNSFTNVGRGGIPATPKDPLNEQEIATNWVRLNPQDTRPLAPIATTPTPTTQPLSARRYANGSAQGKPIVEAQAWRRESNGDIVLVAAASGNLPRQPQPQAGCVDR
jgi:filamentous hemagglutinin family protein